MTEPDLGNAVAAIQRRPPPENFPVGSPLLPRRLQTPLLALHGCLRLADDLADAAHLAPATKIAALDELERTIVLGDGPPWAASAIRLAAIANQRGVSLAPMHQLFEAFRQDSSGVQCQTWQDLMAYCHLSAEPVADLALAFADAPAGAYPPGRALASAHQVLDHVQDLSADYHRRSRVYLPVNWLTEAGGAPADLGATASSPAVSAAKRRALAGARLLLGRSETLPRYLRGTRLALETRVMIALGYRLLHKLTVTDPLVQKPRLTGGETAVAVLKTFSGGKLS